MLHKETVKPGTLDLINQLMQDQQFNSFYLVGGTALSLRLGHRESIDIDLFNTSDFDSDKLAIHLQKEYGAQVKRRKSNYVSGNIREVDFDLIAHKYPSVKSPEIIQGIRMMSMEDIAAMKINAIVNSGTRIKDFIDIHYLLKELSCESIIDFYCSKYSDVDAGMARSSLLYHKDIDFTVPVVLRDKGLKWADVQKSIISSVYVYDQLLENKQLDLNKLGKDENKRYKRGIRR
jgi:hypothetical protein